MKQPIITVKTLWTLIILVIVAFLLSMVVQQPRMVPNMIPHEEQDQSVTVVGNMTCLLHKDTTGPTTLECAYGIASVEGVYYALDLSQVSSDVSSISFDQQIAVTGHLTPLAALSNNEWQKYDIVGIIQVESVDQQSL